MNNSSAKNLVIGANSPIDLQLHTRYSDGAWEPDQLLDYVKQEQFSLVAITDHDRVDTIAEIQRLAQVKQIPVLVATEMTTRWRGELTDILCFGFDPGHPGLNQLTQGLLARQRETTRQAYEYLQREGHLPDRPDAILQTLLDEPAAQQIHALIALLVEHKQTDEPLRLGEIFRPIGFQLATNDTSIVVETVHDAGGICLVAHPGRSDGFISYDTDLLDQLCQEIPIDGIEVYYPAHTPEQTAEFLAYAEKHDLFISAGSDSHIPKKPPIKYPAHTCRRLLEHLGIQVKG